MTKTIFRCLTAITVILLIISIISCIIVFRLTSSKPSSDIKSDSWSYIEVVGDNGQMVPCVRQHVNVGDSKQLVTVCDWDGVADTHNNYGK